MWLAIPLVKCGDESSDLVFGSGFLSFLVLSSCRLFLLGGGDCLAWSEPLLVSDGVLV